MVVCSYSCSSISQDEWISSCQYSFLLLCIIHFFTLIFIAQIFVKLLSKYNSNFPLLSELKKRKVIIFALNVIFRLSVFVMILIISFQYWSFKKGVEIDTCYGVKLLQIVCVQLTTLMLYELVRMPEFGWDMWVHHSITIFVSLTLGDKIPYTNKKAFRNDPYYMEILLSVGLGAALVFATQIGWVYLHLLSFDKDTVISLNRMKTDYLKEIELTQQTSLATLFDNVMFSNSASSNSNSKSNSMSNMNDHEEIAVNTVDKINKVDTFDTIDIDSHNNATIATETIATKELKDFAKKKDVDKNGRSVAVNVIFNEMDISEMTLDNLILNYKSTKIKHKIITFRLIILVFIYCVLFVGIPIPLFIIRMINDNFYAIETKVFLGVLLSCNTIVETYLVNVIIQLYRKETKKCKKYRLAIDSYKKKQQATDPQLNKAKSIQLTGT